MTSISAALIVRNEAAMLGPCLESLAGVVDDVVVVDTGSSDGTPALAEGHGARLATFAWCDDFAAARNFALDQAAHDWVLVIDADERIRNRLEAGGLLRAFVAEQGSGALGTLQIVSPTRPGPETQVAADHTIRFFHREYVRYAGAIHEQPVHRSAEAVVASTGVIVDHLGYAQDPEDEGHKAHRNIRILERALAETPNDEYLHYQLGKSYFALERYADSVESLSRALAAVSFAPGAMPTGHQGPVARPVLTGMLTTLAYALVNAERLDEAARVLAKHASLGHPGTCRADFDHARGYVALVQGDLALARACYEASMARGAEAEDVLGTGSHASAYHLGLIDEAEGNLAAAMEHYRLSLRLKPDYRVTLARCVDLVHEQGLDLAESIADVCDGQALRGVYEAKLTALLEAGRIDALRTLTESAARFSPALLAVCRAVLARFAAG